MSTKSKQTLTQLLFRRSSTANNKPILVLGNTSANQIISDDRIKFLGNRRERSRVLIIHPRVETLMPRHGGDGGGGHVAFCDKPVLIGRARSSSPSSRIATRRTHSERKPVSILKNRITNRRNDSHEFLLLPEKFHNSSKEFHTRGAPHKELSGKSTLQRTKSNPTFGAKTRPDEDRNQQLDKPSHTNPLEELSWSCPTLEKRKELIMKYLNDNVFDKGNYQNLRSMMNDNSGDIDGNACAIEHIYNEIDENCNNNNTYKNIEILKPLPNRVINASKEARKPQNTDSLKPPIAPKKFRLNIPVINNGRDDSPNSGCNSNQPIYDKVLSRSSSFNVYEDLQTFRSRSELSKGDLDDGRKLPDGNNNLSLASFASQVAHQAKSFKNGEPLAKNALSNKLTPSHSFSSPSSTLTRSRSSHPLDACKIDEMYTQIEKRSRRLRMPLIIPIKKVPPPPTRLFRGTSNANAYKAPDSDSNSNPPSRYENNNKNQLSVRITTSPNNITNVVIPNNANSKEYESSTEPTPITEVSSPLTPEQLKLEEWLVKEGKQLEPPIRTITSLFSVGGGTKNNAEESLLLQLNPNLPPPLVRSDKICISKDCLSSSSSSSSSSSTEEYSEESESLSFSSNNAAASIAISGKPVRPPRGSKNRAIISSPISIRGEAQVEVASVRSSSSLRDLKRRKEVYEDSPEKHCMQSQLVVPPPPQFSSVISSSFIGSTSVDIGFPLPSPSQRRRHIVANIIDSTTSSPKWYPLVELVNEEEGGEIDSLLREKSVQDQRLLRGKAFDEKTESEILQVDLKYSNVPSDLAQPCQKLHSQLLESHFQEKSDAHLAKLTVEATYQSNFEVGDKIETFPETVPTPDKSNGSLSFSKVATARFQPVHPAKAFAQALLFTNMEHLEIGGPTTGAESVVIDANQESFHTNVTIVDVPDQLLEDGKECNFLDLKTEKDLFGSENNFIDFGEDLKNCESKDTDSGGGSGTNTSDLSSDGSGSTCSEDREALAYPEDKMAFDAATTPNHFLRQEAKYFDDVDEDGGFESFQVVDNEGDAYGMEEDEGTYEPYSAPSSSGSNHSGSPDHALSVANRQRTFAQSQQNVPASELKQKASSVLDLINAEISDLHMRELELRQKMKEEEVEGSSQADSDDFSDSAVDIESYSRASNSSGNVTPADIRAHSQNEQDSLRNSSEPEKFVEFDDEKSSGHYRPEVLLEADSSTKTKNHENAAAEDAPDGLVNSVATKESPARVRPIVEEEVKSIELNISRETPIEREIRLVREREEEFRRSKGFTNDNESQGQEQSYQKADREVIKSYISTEENVEPNIQEIKASLASANANSNSGNGPKDIQYEMATARLKRELEENLMRERELYHQGRLKTLSVSQSIDEEEDKGEQVSGVEESHQKSESNAEERNILPSAGRRISVKMPPTSSGTKREETRNLSPLTTPTAKGGFGTPVTSPAAKTTPPVYPIVVSNGMAPVKRDSLTSPSSPRMPLGNMAKPQFTSIERMILKSSFSFSKSMSEEPSSGLPEEIHHVQSSLSARKPDPLQIVHRAESIDETEEGTAPEVGKPRRKYIQAQDKIQVELQDQIKRETELSQLRAKWKSTPDLSNYSEDDNGEGCTAESTKERSHDAENLTKPSYLRRQVSESVAAAPADVSTSDVLKMNKPTIRRRQSALINQWEEMIKQHEQKNKN